MAVALNVLVSRGALYLARTHIDFLLRHGRQFRRAPCAIGAVQCADILHSVRTYAESHATGYAEQVAQCGDGIFLRSLPPADQADVLLTSAAEAVAALPTLQRTMGDLDDARLRRIAQYVSSWGLALAGSLELTPIASVGADYWPTGSSTRLSIRGSCAQRSPRGG